MGSINETLLGAIINDEQIHLSGLEARNARILQSIIDGTPYTAAPESPIEELLLELKVKIEQGGAAVSYLRECLTARLRKLSRMTQALYLTGHI